MEQKPNTAMKIFGWLSLIAFLTGNFFRIMHWPGAGPAIIFGCLFFMLFYTPLWFIQVSKVKENRGIKIIQFITLLFYTLANLFKTMHWPGAGIVFNGFYFYTLVFFIPFTFYLFFKAGKTSTTSFHNILLIFFIASSTTSALFRSVSGNVLNAFDQNSAQVERSIIRTNLKNNKLKEALEKIEDKQQNIYYQNAQKVIRLSDTAVKHIWELQNYIISEVDGIPLSKADSIPISGLMNKTNYDIPNIILIGDMNKLNTGKYSGLQLKSMIDAYRDSSINLIDSENKEFIKSGINLETNNQSDEEGETMNWVNFTFYNMPAITSLSTLSGIELEIRNAETQLLADLLNSATKHSGNNLAMKIADMGMKMEREAKEQKIALLEKESELNQISLNAKRTQLQEANQTIVFFLVGILICSVLIFFIIRSNLERKKINKELKAQKHVIEEKNKEITDSINYAKRIQISHLPTHKYIESKLKKLMKG